MNRNRVNSNSYHLGIKLAMADAGLLTPATDPILAKIALHPAEALATILQGVPSETGEQEIELEEPIGAPKDDYRTFSGSSAGRGPSNPLGFDVSGFEDTSVTL